MGKIEYELYLRTWSHLNPNAKEDLDYETIDFVLCANYRDAVRQAKDISKRIPYTDRRGDEIVQVQLAAFIPDEEERYGTSYWLLWKETYEKGRGCGRIKCDY